MSREGYVCVPVATLWTAPDRARPIDAAALAVPGDVAAWVAGMDEKARYDLRDRVETQLLRGERVIAEEEHNGWLRIVAISQPAPWLDDRGYPGWLPAGQIALGRPPQEPSSPGLGAEPITTAAGLLGTRYLWGGITRYGIDCSGLVHLAHRAAGQVVPRNSEEQQAWAQPVPLGQERRGDLYFFAEDGRPAHHVGFVVEPGEMLDACYESGGVVQHGLSTERKATLVGVGRFAGPDAAGRPGPVRSTTDLRTADDPTTPDTPFADRT